MDSILKYWPIILFALNFLALWVAWSARRVIPNKEEIEKRLAEQDKAIIRLEEAMKRAPTHSDIKELSSRIEALHGDLQSVVGSLTGIRRAVDLMNEYLLNRRQE